MDEKKRSTFWDALSKLPIREQVTIFLAFIALITGVVIGIFYLMLSTTSFVSFEIPEPNLQSEGNIQTYRRLTYPQLDTLVQFPGTDYAVYVGGEGQQFTDYIASFKFNDNNMILVGVCDKTQSMSDFYNYAVPYGVEGVAEQGKKAYTSMAHKEGYLNTMFLIYEGGSLKLSSSTKYILSYQYDIGDKYLIMATVFNEPNKISAMSAMSLLDKVFHTLSRIENEEDISTDESSEAVSVETVQQRSSSTDISSDMTSTDSVIESYMNKSPTEIIKENKETIAERNYKLEYPDATDLEAVVTSTEELQSEESVFYIWYSEAEAIPDEVYLISPGGLKYSPTYINEKEDGMIYWVVNGPSKGDWIIHLSANIRYGSYSTNVLKRSVFDITFGEQTEPYPKEGD